jgi:3-hydroxyacyl-[acyl-carrier protein] dehydratase/trans-2-decenoyl-[acyl-carrier protein] isomerase
MKYAEFLERTQFSKSELLASAQGTLVGDPPADGVPQLPAPPFLMFDRVVEVERRGAQGLIVAEQDVALDAWYFQCHFRGDPVQPGCLGVDAIWQLIGFYAALRGARGAGRALGSKEIEFSGQIRPHNKVVRPARAARSRSVPAKY